MERREAEIVTGIAAVAFAALARELGCPTDRVGDLYDAMADYVTPSDPTEAIAMMTRGLTDIGITDINLT